MYPVGNTNSAFVTSIYTNLFNRAPDADGLAYWVAELDNATMTRDVMIEAMKNGATGTDATIIANKATVGLAYADAGLEGTDFSLASVTADAATVDAGLLGVDAIANVGTTFTLTAATAAQILVGTAKNDTFIGDKNSIDGADKFVDGSTADHDTANVSFNAALPALTIANVENVNVTISNISALTAVDATNFSGVNTLTVTKADVVVGTSTLTGNKAVTVAALNADSVAKVVAGVGTTDVLVTQVTKAGVVVDASTATGNVTVTGATTVTANAMGTGDTLTVNALADPTEDAKAVSVTTTAETISIGAFTGAITVDAASAKNVTLAGALGGATITATGEKGTVGTDGIVVADIDDTGVTITTSYVGTTTDNNVISLAGTAGTTTDVATVSAAGVTKLKLAAMEGVTLSGNGQAATYIISNAAATTYTVAGTQAVTLSGADTMFTGKTVSGATAVVLSTTAGADFDASKFSNVATIKVGADIGANQIKVVDGQTVEFTSATQTALDFDFVTGAKNVNIVAGDVNSTSTAIGTLNVGAFDASAGATDVGNVKITANESNFTAASATIGAKQTLVLEGSKNFDLGVVTAKALDATAATGVIKASNGAGAGATVVTMNTGSANDLLTSNTSSVITINSASGDDTITLTAAAATSEIITGEGNDTVNIASATATGAIVINLEAGDDKVTMDGAISAVLVAGEGSDTLFVTADADETAKSTFAMSGFEKLDLTEAGVQIDVTLTAAQFANNSTMELSGADSNDIFTVVANATTGSTINASGLTVKSGAGVTVNYTGSAKADTITGGTAAENFTMTAGHDSIEGGSGTAVDTFTAAIVADTGTAVSAVINLGGSEISSTELLSKTGYRTAGDASVAANTAVSLFDDTTSTNVASVTTLGGIEAVVGTSAKDYIVASSSGTTITGGAGADYIKLGTGIDTVKFSTVATNGADTIFGFTAGTGGDVLNVSGLATLTGTGFLLASTATVATTVATNAFYAVTDNAAANWSDVATVIAAAINESGTGTEKAVFAIYNGTDTNVYYYLNDGTDNVVQTAELTLLGTLLGVDAANLVSTNIA